MALGRRPMTKVTQSNVSDVTVTLTQCGKTENFLPLKKYFVKLTMTHSAENPKNISSNQLFNNFLTK